MRRFFPLVLLALAWAQVYHPTATLIYNDTEVVVEKTSPDELGLAWIEENDEGVLFIFYDPPPYRVRAAFGDAALAWAPLALVNQPDAGGGRVLLSGGRAYYDEVEDRVRYELVEDPEAVEVQKGRFLARGGQLGYDNERGLARLKGPVRFERKAEKPLTGQAGELLYVLDDDELWLLGGVELRQEDRTTRADRALVLEEQGIAYLFGNPVVSERPGERLSGKVLGYRLESGELWIVGGVEGRMEKGP